jgi:diadenosine tetraphosphatase ApaH/serine/threonine PP2A family protein phosphatase
MEATLASELIAAGIILGNCEYEKALWERCTGGVAAVNDAANPPVGTFAVPGLYVVYCGAYWCDKRKGAVCLGASVILAIHFFDVHWGTVSMRYLVMSDIHANLVALEAVLEDAEGTYDKVWCLGDIVGYGPNPNECVETIRYLDGLAIAGNHDWAVMGRLDIDHFNSDARKALLWTRSVVTEGNKRYLDQLEVSLVEEEDFTLVHGSPRYPVWEYLLYPEVAQVNFSHFATPYCLVGHTHSPVIFLETQEEPKRYLLETPQFNDGPRPLPAARMILNPGSVGQPRDGDPRAAYGILDTEDGTFDFRRVMYDVEETQQRMITLGFAPRLVARLGLGH